VEKVSLSYSSKRRWVLKLVREDVVQLKGRDEDNEKDRSMESGPGNFERSDVARLWFSKEIQPLQ